MNLQLYPKVGNGIKQEKWIEWLLNNRRVEIEYKENGVCVKNICCRNLVIRCNGLTKKIVKGKSSKLLQIGQEILIEGKTFIVSPQ